MTIEETNAATLAHIMRVRDLLNKMIIDLLDRGRKHDQSKLISPEVELFTEYTEKLATCTYGSDEYKTFLKEMAPALEHHYANNRHHPEHYPKGVNDMTLMDLVEMLCDWKASSERHNDGNILKSIEINMKRFEITPQLAGILTNTAKEMFK